jgi:CheY-like chemotaxis protein
MNDTDPFTVLLVEDHEDSREAIKRWLEWKGWCVLEAADKKSAAALGRKHSIDLLLCDLQLPDGDGWELMAALKDHRPRCGIVTSGRCSSTDMARSKAEGFMAHLIKPYSVEALDDLLETVTQQLGGNGSPKLQA